MTLQVNIEADNAAFEDDRDEEVARILREVAKKVEDGYCGGKCVDYNGNTVGDWRLTA